MARQLGYASAKETVPLENLSLSYLQDANVAAEKANNFKMNS
jgi:hypothetical protein